MMPSADIDAAIVNAIVELGEQETTALLLQALRAEHDPETRKGPVFTDPRDLSIYLTSLTGEHDGCSIGA